MYIYIVKEKPKEKGMNTKKKRQCLDIFKAINERNYIQIPIVYLVCVYVYVYVVCYFVYNTYSVWAAGWVKTNIYVYVYDGDFVDI